MYVDIKKSTNKEKKLMAIFYNNEKHILWNKPTLKASIEDYKKRFKLL
jgi:hypothetical protein